MDIQRSFDPNSKYTFFFYKYGTDFITYTLRELSYTDLKITSTELLEKQSSFDKIGRSLHV